MTIGRQGGNAEVGAAHPPLGSVSMAGSDRRGLRRMRAGRAGLAALLIAAAGLAGAPAAGAAAAGARLSVDSTWQTGFIARFAIVNSSAAPMSDWRLEFDLPVGESIQHAWNSTVRQVGTHYVVTGANWNRTIAPGGSATGGFRGVINGAYSPPVNCVLNGMYRCS